MKYLALLKAFPLIVRMFKASYEAITEDGRFSKGDVYRAAAVACQELADEFEDRAEKLDGLVR